MRGGREHLEINFWLRSWTPKTARIHGWTIMATKKRLLTDKNLLATENFTRDVVINDQTPANWQCSSVIYVL